MLVASVVGLLGTIRLQKEALLASSLLFAIVIPALIPHMIFLAKAQNFQFFIALSLFSFLIGSFGIYLFSLLTNELDARKGQVQLKALYLNASKSPSSQNEIQISTNCVICGENNAAASKFSPCGHRTCQKCAFDKVVLNSTERAITRCPTCEKRVNFISEP